MSSTIVDALGRIPLSANLMATLTRAAAYAGAQQHREVALEHLLLALTEDPDAALVMSISNVELDSLKADISSHVGRMEAAVTQSPVSELRIAPELRGILQAAAAAAEGHRNEIDGAIVLAAIIGEGKTASAGMLRAHGLTFKTAIEALQQATALQAQRAAASPSAPAPAASPAAIEAPVAMPQPPAPEAEPRAPIVHHSQTSAEDILASARQRVQGRIAPGLSDIRPAAKPEAPPVAADDTPSRSDSLAAAEAAIEAEFERISAETAAQEAAAATAPRADAEHAAPPGELTAQPAPPAHRPSPPGALRPRPPEPQQPTATAAAASAAAATAAVHPPQPAAAHPDPHPAPVQSTAARPQTTVDEVRAAAAHGTISPPPAPRPPVQQRPPAPAPSAGAAQPVPSAAPAPHQPPLPPGRPASHHPPTGPVSQRGAHGDATLVQTPPPRPSLPGLPGMEPRPGLPPAGQAPRVGPPPLPAPVGPAPPPAPQVGGAFPPPHRPGPPLAPGAHPPAADAMQPRQLPPVPAPSPPAYGRPPGPQPMPDGPRRPIHSSVTIGQLVENVPRVMRVAVPAMVEVRIARAEVKAVADGMQGGGMPRRHEINVTKAMSVRLRAPDGGFTIEPASPETQWIDGVLGPMTDDYASWRWSVTPQVRGYRRLQVVVGARTVSDGLSAETALPDQIVEVRVKTNYGRAMKRFGGWAVAAVAGGLLAHFGQGLPALTMQLMQMVVK